MITAAASIMILVFLSFVLSGSIIIQQFGIGLAAAIIIDAFVVRTVLVPALMHLCGRPTGGFPDGSTGGCRPYTSRAKLVGKGRYRASAQRGRPRLPNLVGMGWPSVGE